MFEKSQHLLDGYTKEQASELFYEGRKCKHCGNVLRYKKGYFCVQCARNHSRKQYARQATGIDEVSKNNPDKVREASKAVTELLTKKYASAQSLHAAMRKKGFDKQVTLAALKQLGVEKEKIGGSYHYKPIKQDKIGSETQNIVQQVFHDYSMVSPVEHKSPERILLEKLNFISSELISTNHKMLEVLNELRKPNVFIRAYISVKDWLTK